MHIEIQPHRAKDASKERREKLFQSFADSIAMEMINDCFAGIFDGKSLPSDADREIAYTNLEEALATLLGPGVLRGKFHDSEDVSESNLQQTVLHALLKRLNKLQQSWPQTESRSFFLEAKRLIQEHIA